MSSIAHATRHILASAVHLQPRIQHNQQHMFQNSLSSLRSFCKWAQPSTPVAAESQPAAAAAEISDTPPQHSAAEAASSFITADAATAAAASGTTPGNAAAAVAASAGGVLAGAAAAPAAEYTMRQVSKHATDESCWIVVNGKVRHCNHTRPLSVKVHHCITA